MKLKAAHGQQVGRAIPAYIVKGVEVIGYFGNGRSNDALIKSHEEDGQC